MWCDGRACSPIILGTVLLGLCTTPVAAQTFGAVADTFVDSAVPNTNSNFGNLSFAEVGFSGPPKDAIDRALLQFDLSSLPPASGPVRATLRLFISATSVDALGLVVEVHPLAPGQTFDELTVTWNTQPAVAAVVATSVMDTPVGEWFAMDVSEPVAAQRAGPNPTQVYLRVGSPVASGDEIFLDFLTKESMTPDLRAQLVLDLGVAAPSASLPVLIFASLALLALALRRMQRA